MRIQNLPRPTRFMFWCTAPFFIVTLALLPLFSNPVGLIGWLVIGAFEALCIFALFGLYDSRRFNWCWRIVGGIVFVAYVAYLASMIVSGQWIDGRRSSATAFNALFGLYFFGYPGFMYAAFGRFTWVAASEVDDCNDNCVGTTMLDRESDNR